MVRTYDLARYLICPSRRLFGVLAKIRSNSVLPSIQAELEKHKIIVCYLSLVMWNSESRLIAFLDVTDSDVDPKALAEELQRKELLEVFEYIESTTEGFIVDTASFPLVAQSQRAVIMREDAYREFLVGIREFFGVPSGPFLYHVGVRTGIGCARNHKKIADRLGMRDPAEIFKSICAPIFQSNGYGRMEVKELTQDCGVILIHESFEGALMRGKSPVPYAQFVRGMIAGILAELFGKGFNVVEEQCIAKGDPYCRFVVKAIPQTKPT